MKTKLVSEKNKLENIIINESIKEFKIVDSDYSIIEQHKIVKNSLNDVNTFSSNKKSYSLRYDNVYNYNRTNEDRYFIVKDSFSELIKSYNPFKKLSDGEYDENVFNENDVKDISEFNDINQISDAYSKNNIINVSRYSSTIRDLNNDIIPLPFRLSFFTHDIKKRSEVMEFLQRNEKVIKIFKSKSPNNIDTVNIDPIILLDMDDYKTLYAEKNDINSFTDLTQLDSFKELGEILKDSIVLNK